MIRQGIFFVIVVLFSCCEPAYKRVTVRWQDPRVAQPDVEYTHLSKVAGVAGEPHGTEVKVRGKLVYEYDDAAIYPFSDCTDLKPIWIHIDQHEADLHSFLLENGDALVTVVGVVDTLEYFDRRQYGGAIKDIVYVDVSYITEK